MGSREHSSALVFSLAAFVLAVLVGVAISLGGGLSSGSDTLDWTPPATTTVQVNSVRLAPTQAPSTTPAPTATSSPVASRTPPPPTKAPTATPTVPAVARIAAGPVNLRAGPGTGYPVLATTKGGEEYAITGRSEDLQWVQVCCVAEARAWVSTQFAELPKPVDGYPIVR